MASDKVQTFTDGNFDQETKNGVVLVDFWAEWCGPCRLLAPTVEALAGEFDGRVTVGKLNVDENQRTVIQFSVLSIPTVILFDGGEAKETVVGARSKSHFEKAWADWPGRRAA